MAGGPAYIVESGKATSGGKVYTLLAALPSVLRGYPCYQLATLV